MGLDPLFEDTLMGQRKMTYDDVKMEFAIQFPGLHTEEIRPLNPCVLFIRMRHKPNLVATYNEEENTFCVETTNQDWLILEKQPRKHTLKKEPPFEPEWHYDPSRNVLGHVDKVDSSKGFDITISVTLNPDGVAFFSKELHIPTGGGL